MVNREASASLHTTGGSGSQELLCIFMPDDQLYLRSTHHHDAGKNILMVAVALVAIIQAKQ